MEEIENEEPTGEERVSISLNRFGGGMSYRLTITDAKNFDDAIEKIMNAKNKLVDSLQKGGEKIITQSEYKKY